MPKADFAPRPPRRNNAVIDFILLSSTLVFLAEAAVMTLTIVARSR